MPSGSPRSAPLGPFRTLGFQALALAAAIFTLLEFWRPCFFLTDDNLSAGLPFFSGMGQRLMHGQSPFICDFLFGGNYNALRDPNYFVWHPLYLLTSLLAVTPAHFWVIEAQAFVLLMITVVGFIKLAQYLRHELKLPISDGWILFYSMSYTFSFMALGAGASWSNFLCNHSALPWLALGILQTRPGWGFGLVLLFVTHDILGGHFAALISTSLFLSAFALGVAWWRRSTVPLISWFAGYGLALLLVSPLVLQAIHGFMTSARSGGLSIEEMQVSRIPLIYFPGSYFAGTSFWLMKHPTDFHVYHPALAACAAAWCVFPVLASRGRWHFLEKLCLGLMVVVVFLIIRPTWVSTVMAHLPLLRSLRAPFRELLEFHFFLHLLLILRTPAFAPAFRRALATWSCLIFVVPMWLYPPPSFNPMAQQRQLLFSGDFDRYWVEVKRHLKPTDPIIPVVPREAVQISGEWAPYALLGGHDFAGLAGVINGTGYSPTAPTDQLYLQERPFSNYGYYTSDQMEQVWREKPDAKMLVLESTNPIRISLRSKDGETIDLTPLIPKYVRIIAP